MDTSTLEPPLQLAATTVLLVEDDPADARYLELLCAELGPDRFQLLRVGDLASGLRRLRDGGVDMVLLDLHLPDSQGIETVLAVQSASPSVPIIVLTGTEGDEMALKAMNVGAQDYLRKGEVDSRTLARAVGYAIVRKRLAERSLAHARAEQLITSISAILIGVDETGLVVRWNATAAKTFGIPSTAVVGRPFRACRIPWADPNLAERILDRPLDDQPMSFEDLKFAGVDGSERLLSLTVNRVKTDGGRPAGVVMLGSETTEKRRLEEQLRQSQKLESIGQLAAGVAHEFKNLLCTIRGFAEITLDDVPSGSQAHANLGYIFEVVERATTITSQLLSFSRRQVLKWSDVSLNAMIADFLAMLRPIVGRHIDVTTNLDDDLWRVRADVGLLAQVLMNLCLNARDAMPTGGTLNIRTENVTVREADADATPEIAPGQHALLTVSDTGRGMTPDIAARVFEPFFTTKKTGKGTGLGLSMAYGIIRQHHGTIQVESQMGVGTWFAIYLPAIREPQGRSGNPSAEQVQFLPAPLHDLFLPVVSAEA